MQRLSLEVIYDEDFQGTSLGRNVDKPDMLLCARVYHKSPPRGPWRAGYDNRVLPLWQNKLSCHSEIITK